MVSICFLAHFEHFYKNNFFLSEVSFLSYRAKKVQKIRISMMFRHCRQHHDNKKSYFHNEIWLNYLCPRAIYSSRAKHCQRNGKPKSYFHLQRPMVTDNEILFLEKLHWPSYLHPWSNVFLPECLVCLEAGDACSGWRRDLDREN